MAENRQRGPSLGAGVAGGGRIALPPGLAGGAGRGSDGAAPVVAGALDWLLLACSIRLYPIANPRIARTTTRAASQGHIDPPLLGPSRSRRRGTSERRASVSRGSDMLLLLSLNRRNLRRFVSTTNRRECSQTRFPLPAIQMLSGRNPGAQALLRHRGRFLRDQE